MRILSILTALSLLAGAPPVDGGSEGGERRRFEFEYRALVKDLPHDARQVHIWLPYPQSDAHQAIADVSVEGPVEYEIRREPEQGNAIVHLALAPPAQGTIEVAMRFRVARQEYERRDLHSPAGGAIPAAARKWLQPDRLVPIDSRIRALAERVTAGRTTPLGRARAIYDYVVTTMRYDKGGEGWGQGDLYWACDQKRGNCTDFHALFIGLCRAVGIPAKFSIGFPLPAERGAGDVPGYHCWAEFYLAGYGWVPVDTSEASKHPEKRDYFFGAHDENRVQLSVGRDLMLAPRQTGQPLNYFIYAYVEVDGRAHAGVEQRFRFRDLDGGAASR